MTFKEKGPIGHCSVYTVHMISNPGLSVADSLCQEHFGHSSPVYMYLYLAQLLWYPTLLSCYAHKITQFISQPGPLSVRSCILAEK